MVQTPAPSGPWSDADRYEAYVGRWSRPVARQFLAQLGVPTGRRWLDVGCGTGALTTAVLADRAPTAVLGVDASPGFVNHAGAGIRDPRATFRTGDALALPVDDAAVDIVVSGLVLNFLPDQLAAVTEWRRVTEPGGLVAAYVWDYASGMELIRRFWDAAVESDPAAIGLDEGRRFLGCAPGPLHALFTGAGLTDVATGSIEVPTVFAGFDDYWSPFLGGTGPAPAYVTTLSEHDRLSLREALRQRLPADDDGSIHLTARAWTVRGRVPGLAGRA
jgi:SAM-dependent methyltransferase